MEKFIVYSHIDSSGVPFYIGSGMIGRENEKGGRSKTWYHRVKHLNGLYGVRILSTHDSKQEALQEEQRQIGLHRATVINGQRGSYSMLGGHIKAKRKAVDLTQEEMATKAGVGLRFVRELEYGKGSVRLDTVNKVLRLFGEELGPIPMSHS